jgi:hypothetical protein
MKKVKVGKTHEQLQKINAGDLAEVLHSYKEKK